MRTFISNRNIDEVIIAYQYQNFGVGRLDGSWTKEKNADKADILMAVASLYDFDPNESSSWTPSESNAVDEAFAFVDSFYPRVGSSDDRPRPDVDAKVFVNLNTGATLLARMNRI